MEAGSATSRKAQKANITSRALLTIEAKQDIEEIYGYIDADRKGYFTDQELHAALNEAAGKTVSNKAVRALAARMDASGHQGTQVLHHDFVEYMAQKIQLAEPYDELLRSEQAQLMREVGSKVYEMLEQFKRRRMLQDAMGGGDGIKRLLKLTHVPVGRPSRRKGPPGQAGLGLGGAASRSASVRSLSPQRSSPQRRRPDSAASIGAASQAAGSGSGRISGSGGGGVHRVSSSGGVARTSSSSGGSGGVRVAAEAEGGASGASRGARRTSSSPSRLSSASFGRVGSLRVEAVARSGSGRHSGAGEQRSPPRGADGPPAAAAPATGPEAERAARLALVAAAAAAAARPPDALVSAQVGGAPHTFSVRRLTTAATGDSAQWRAFDVADGAISAKRPSAAPDPGALSAAAAAAAAAGGGTATSLVDRPVPISAASAPQRVSTLTDRTSRSRGGGSGSASLAAAAAAVATGSGSGGGRPSWRSPELLAQVLNCLGRSGISDPELHNVAQGLGLAPSPAAETGYGLETDLGWAQNARVSRSPPPNPTGIMGSDGQSAVSHLLLGTPAAEAVILDVSGPIELDPLLAKLPGWVRKRLGLPPSPAPEQAPAPAPVPAPAPAPVPQTVLRLGPRRAASADSAPAAAGGAHTADSSTPLTGWGAAVTGVPSAWDATARDGDRHSTGDGTSASNPGSGAVAAGAESFPVPTTPSRRGSSNRPLSGRSANSLQRYMPFGGDTAAVVAEEGTEESEGEPPLLPPPGPPSPKAWLPAAPSPLRRSSTDAREAAVGGAAAALAERPRSASPLTIPSPSTAPPQRDFSLRRPASASAALSGRTTPVVIAPTPSARPAHAAATEAEAEVQVGEPNAAMAKEAAAAAAAAEGPCFGSPSKRRSTAEWLAAAAAAEPGAVAGSVGAGESGRRDDWTLSQLSSAGCSFALGAEGEDEEALYDGAECRRGGEEAGGAALPARQQGVQQRDGDAPPPPPEEGVVGGGEGEGARTARGSVVSSLLMPHSATAAAASADAELPGSPVLPDPHAPAPAAALKPEADPPPPMPDALPGRRPGIVAALASSADSDSAAGGQPAVRWSVSSRSSRSPSRGWPQPQPRPRSRSRSHPPPPHSSAAGAGVGAAAAAVRTYPGPPFIAGPLPDMPQSAFQVVAAAEAALAAADAAADGVNGGGSATGTTHWSVEYTLPVRTAVSAVLPASAEASPGGGSRSSTPVVHLNRTSLLRLNSQYGTDAVAAAGAALGLRSSSAAVQEVAARSVLRSLSCRGAADGAVSGGGSGGGGDGGGGVPGRPTPGSAAQFLSGSFGAGAHHATPGAVSEPWPPHAAGYLPASSAYCPDPGLPGPGGGDSGGGSGGGVSPSARRGPHARPHRSASATAAAQPHQQPQEQRHQHHHHPAYLLPSDALGLGRQLKVLATKLSSEGGGVASRPSSASAGGPQRPFSASRSGSTALRASSPSPSHSPRLAASPRPASATPTATPRPPIARPGSARTLGSAGGGGGDVSAAAARPRSASAAASSSVLAPSRTRPSIVSRVQRLDGEEVSSCLSASAAPSSVGPAVCAATESVSRRSLLAALLRLQEEEGDLSSGAPSEAGVALDERSGAGEEGDGDGGGGGDGTGFSGRDGGQGAGSGDAGVDGGDGGGGGGGGVRVASYAASHPGGTGGGDGGPGGATGPDSGGAAERRRLEVTGTVALTQARPSTARKITWRQGLTILG